MKYFFIYISLLECISFGLAAQNKTYIGDTSNVIYVKSYDANPELDSITVVKARNSDSDWIVYFDKTEKSIAYSSYLNGDSLITCDYWRNGKLKQKNVKIKDKMRGFYIWIIQQIYCQNGQCVAILFPNDPKKHHYITYYCDGKKKHEYNEINGRFDGEEYWYYPDGKIRSTASYRYVFTDDSISHNYPVGEWKFYDLSGKIDSTQVYKHYKLIKTIK